MENGEKVKIISLVDEAPLKLNEVYEGEYYYGYSQEMLHSRKYEGYRVIINGNRHHFSINKFIPLAEYRDKQIDSIIN